MDALIPCLGLEFLGQCQYDPGFPSFQIFTLGEAVATLSLVGLATQLKSARLSFRTELHRGKYISAIVLFVLGILMPFVSSLLIALNHTPVPVIGYPIFWEFTGATMVFIAGGLIFIIGTSKARFTRKNHSYFLNAVVRNISTGETKGMLGLMGDLYHSADNIAEFVSQYDRAEASARRKLHQPYLTRPEVMSALDLLNVMSDEEFCKLMVTRSPNVAIKLVNALANYRCWNSGGHNFVRQLATQAFTQRNSLLSREKDYEGLGYINAFSKSLFGNFEVVQHYRPLSGWNFYENDAISYLAIKNYARALQVALGSSAVQLDNTVHPSELYDGLDRLSYPVHRLIQKIQSQNWEYGTDEGKILLNIEKTLIYIIDIVSGLENSLKDQLNIPIPVSSKDAYEIQNDHTIFGVLAKGIYSFFEHLAAFREHDDFIRSSGIELWHKIFPSSNQSKVIDAIQKRLWLLIRAKSVENLTYMWSPYMVRLVLNFDGYSYFQEGKKFLTKEPTAKFLKLLATNLKSTFKNHPERAPELLPPEISYDPGSDTLSYKNSRGIPLNQFL